MLIKRGMKHLSRVNDVMFRRLRVERDITIFPDDVFLTSYPRSGNTWTRFLVGNLVHPQEAVTFLNVERLVPDMYKHSDRTLRNLPRPRILKSHECFDPRYKRIIYIVRDPRDVLISYYEFQLKRRVISDDCSLEEFVPRFMESEIEPKIGTWRDHVVSWTATRGRQKNFLLLRYEDMLADTHKVSTTIASF